MKKSLVFIPLILGISQINSVLASSMDIPLDCGLEPSTFSGHNPENISDLIDAGSLIYQNEASYQDWASLFYALSTIKSSSTMSTTGPDYVLQGVPTRFKYDGSWFDWSSRFFTVRFGTSEFGSEVVKTSNWDNNAYTNLTFNYTHGPGLVWSRGDGCMAKSVIVQTPPTSSITINKTDNGVRIEGTVTASSTVDAYSKVSIDGIPVLYEIQKYIVSEWNGTRCEVVEETSTWETVRSLSTNETFSFDYYSCDIQFRTRAFDGNFYSNWAVRFIPGTAGNTGGGSTGGGNTGGGNTGGSCTGSLCNDEP